VGTQPADFVAEMTRLSEGNFMYLVHALPEIAAGDPSQRVVGEINGLPDGLTGYYKRHWRHETRGCWALPHAQRPVLCFLAASREPVTVQKLIERADLEPGDVKNFIAEWREFLNEDPDTQPPRYRIYHCSFAEFLEAEEDLPWYYSQIATSALAKIPGFLSDGKS